MFSCCDASVLSDTRVFCLRGPDSKSPLLSKNCSRERRGQTGMKMIRNVLKYMPGSSARGHEP